MLHPLKSRWSSSFELAFFRDMNSIKPNAKLVAEECLQEEWEFYYPNNSSGTVKQAESSSHITGALSTDSALTDADTNSVSTPRKEGSQHSLELQFNAKEFVSPPPRMGDDSLANHNLLIPDATPEFVTLHARKDSLGLEDAIDQELEGFGIDIDADEVDLLDDVE